MPQETVLKPTVGLTVPVVQDDPAQTTKITWRTALLGRQKSLVLKIVGSNIWITLPTKHRTTIGRCDIGSSAVPDVDLTLYDAATKGVSRVHVAIEIADGIATVTDLGSTNGTFLNGDKIVPYARRILRDGDEVCFGKLTGYIYFETNK